MNRLEQQLTDKLNERKLAGNLRALSNSRAHVDFSSNDYLGLVTTGVLQQLITDTYPITGVPGSTGSRLLSGNSVEAEALEEKIATFHKAEAALLFNSGFDANTGLIASITNKHTTILYDELCHASVIDGARLSVCKGRFKFRHNDLNDIDDKLKRYYVNGTVIVIVESVYSMDGDQAPLRELAELCYKYDAQLIVDEAHATGVFGNHGEGLVVALGIQDLVFARVHTFGKALGCQGAAVVGSKLLKDYLVNFARSFIYTTAAPPHAIQAINCAYSYLSDPCFSNQTLHDLITYFQTKISAPGMDGWKKSNSAIQVFIPYANESTQTVKSLAQQLQQSGYQVNAILHPTVPLGMERLRVCLHTFNTREEVEGMMHLVHGNK